MTESIGKLTAVSAAGSQLLALVWDDGLTAQVDVSSIAQSHPLLHALQNSDAFAQVALSRDGWSVEWPSGLDFGAAQLRRWALEQKGELMSAEAFRKWLRSTNLTQDKAAEALGLSRRMLAYYLSGEKPIPKTVMLATEGYSARRVA
jgi:hypothetical protein